MPGRFITPKKTAEFVDKIADLGGSHRAEILKGNMVCFNTAKHTNEAIYYNISELEFALQNRKKASFFYFDRNENGEKVYLKDKERYVVDPMTLIFNDDKYYNPSGDALNDALSNDGKAIVRLIKENPAFTQTEMAEKTGFSRAKVQRLMKGLSEKSVIQRSGGKKTGRWNVIL